MADLVLIIAQYSAMFTTFAGFIALVLMTLAARKLTPGTVRTNITNSCIFIFVAVVGVTFMTYYHFTEEMQVSELAEQLWYIFMFAALLLSMYESYNLMTLGKELSDAPILKFKRRMQKK